MKKRLLMLFAIMAVAVAAMARPVDQTTASSAAQAFLKTVSGKTFDLTNITSQTPFHEFYVFTLPDNKGYVLVSGDDCVVPILGYSLNNAFVVENMPAHVKDWLDVYEEQIVFYRERYGELDYGGSPEVRSQWTNLENGVAPEPPLPTVVNPLVTTQWDQSPYYNNLCPYDNSSNERTVTGCAATATAQVMRFWSHPATGYGSHSYTHPTYGTLSANFGTTTYGWSNMPTSLTGSSSSTQVNAVATLMYHVGVALEMDYGPASTGGSGAVTGSNDLSAAAANNALVSYFKYKPTLHFELKENYTDAQWSAMLQADLDNGHPIIYKGRDPSGGHAFVCDGYNNQGQFHFNWGWGGSYDGFYTMGDLHPGTGGTGGNSTYTFNLDNGAILGIEPIANWNTSATTTISATTANTSYGSVSGSGTYNFGDTITIRASANTGCRFYQWSDGSVQNPRQMLATGGSLTLTANIGPLQGDTLGYCFNGKQASLGNGSGNCYWGIKMPGSVVTSGHVLTAVEYYLVESGTYDLTIYTGTTSPTTAVYTQSYTLTNEGAWNTMTLSTPVTIPSSQNFWITLHDNGVAYPCSYSGSSGNADGVLWGSSFSSIMNSGWDIAFMIRGIFTDSGTTPGPGPGPVNCDYPMVLTIGDTTSTTTAYQYPINTYYNYSLSETIIDASELQGLGRITSLSYRYNGANAIATKGNCTIWIQPTTKTVFESNSDIEVLNTATAVMVYSGPMYCSQGWNEFQFTTPFDYDGTSNLVVIVDDNSGDYDGNTYSFSTAACTGYKTLAWYSDSYNPDPNSNSYSGSKQYYQLRVQMRINGCEQVEVGDVTVADGTDNNNYVPVYGFYADAYLRSQTIYPASSLVSATSAEPIPTGADITSITYYLATPASDAMNGTFEVKMKEVSASTLSGFMDMTTATTVYTGALDATGSVMTIEFTTPYSYGGGNLLVEVSEIVESSNYPSAAYQGTNVTGASWQGYSYSSIDAITGEARNFMPKTTFSYSYRSNSASSFCAAPMISIDSVSGRTVWFSWSSSADSVFLTLINNNGQQVWGLFFPPSGNIGATGFELPEAYFPMGYVYLYGLSLCGGTDTSDWNYDIFTVTCNLEEQCPVTVVLNDGYGDGWNGGALDIYDTASGAIVSSISCPDHNLSGDGSTDTMLVNLCPGRAYRVEYRSGQYDDEVSFQFLAANGDTLIDVVYPSAGIQGYFDHSCANAVVCVDAMVSNSDTITNTSSYIPGYSLYEYSYSEVIIPAERLVGIGQINALQFKPHQTNAGDYFTNCEVYLAHTNQQNLSGGFIQDANNFQLVWSGDMSYTSTDWQTLTFSQSFTWDGVNNIVVAVRRNHGAWASGSSFEAYAADAQLARYVYRDGTAYTIGEITGGTATGTVPVYNLIGCEGNTTFCYAVDDLAVSNIDATSATVSWTAGNDGDNLWAFMLNGVVITTTNTNINVFSNLTPATSYTIGVATICGQGDTSAWRTVTFTTNPTCLPVTNITATNITYTGATLQWSGDAANYRVVVNDATSTVYNNVVSDTTVVLTNLTAETNYTVSVYAICAVGDTATVTNGSFYTGYCTPNPTSVDGSGITSVSFGGMTNTTHPASAGYGDYSSMSGSVPAGTTASVDITYATGYTYGTIIWVDWNNNLTFEGNEVVYVGESSNSNPTTLTATFAIPVTQTLGNYRMRILGADSYFNNYTGSIADAANANPCASYTWGVAEDYTLTVTEAPACVAVTDIVVSNITATSATISWTDALNSGATYSVLDITGASVATGLTATTYTVTGLSANTAYTYAVVANCSATDASQATSVSFTTDCADGSCRITIVGADSYGDGWNNAAITMVQGSTTTTFTMTSGATNTENYCIVAGEPMTFTWTSGNFDYEASFEIRDVNDSAIYTCTSGSNLTSGSTFYTLSNPCGIAQPTLDSMLVNIAVNNAAMGTTNPAPGAHYFYEGDTAHVYAIANTGYHLEGWSFYVLYNSTVILDTTVNATATDAFALLGGWVVESGDGNYNFNIIANFAANPVVPDTLTVTFAVNNATMGTTTPAPGTYYYGDGDTVYFSATPNSSYQFVGWLWTVGTYVDTLDASYINAYIPASAMMSYGSMTLTALFEAGNPDSTTITYSVNDATMGTINPAPGTYTIYVGNSIQPTAIPNTGYLLDAWVLNVYSATGTTLMDDTLFSTDPDFSNPYNFGTVPQSFADNGYTIGVKALFVAEPVVVDTLTVTFAVNNAAMGTTTPAPGTYYYFDGDTVYFSATPNSGYQFVGWLWTVGTYVDTLDASYINAYIPASAMMSYGSMTLTALFEAGNPDSTTITYSVNDATMGTINPAPGTYTIYVGNSIQPTAIPNTGYLLDAWVLNVYSATGTTLMDDTLFSTDPDFSNPYNFGTVPQSFADNGYTIGVKALFVAEPVVVDTLTVTFAVNNAAMGTTSPAPGTYYYFAGDTVRFQAVPNYGYHFSGWIMSANGESDTLGAEYISAYVPANAIMQYGSMTLTALFEAGNPDSTTITYAVNDATMGTTVPAPGTHTIYVGNTIQATAIPNPGYVLNAWVFDILVGGNVAVSDTLYSDDSEFENPIVFGTVPQSYVTTYNASFAITAIFAVDTTYVPGDDSVTVILAVNDATMGTTNPAPGTYTFAVGNSAAVTAIANDGYHFVNWTVSMGGVVDSTLTEATYSIDALPAMLAGMTINVIANFAPNAGPQPTYWTVTLSSADATMGTVSPEGDTEVLDGTSFTAHATANEGYRFVAWQSGQTLVSDQAEFTFTVIANTALVAVFEVDTGAPAQYYHVTGVASDPTMGYVTVGESTTNTVLASNGETVTLTAHAYEGYRFVRWSNGETTESINITVDGEDVTVTAYFEVVTGGIEDADMNDVTIYSTDSKIVVRGAEGSAVYVFDVNGRLVNNMANATETVEFRMANTGVYLVKVGAAPAKRVLVVR